MAYQIVYTNAAAIKKHVPKRKIPGRLLLAVATILLIGGMFSTETVQDFFLPGDPETTKDAFSTLTQELKDGERFSDAATAFCRYLLERDNLA